MLLEQDRQLLTAYVDGELSSRQSRQVLKLLHRSAEARALLQQLQANAHAMRQLPRVRSHPALSDSVLQLIRARRLQPARRSVAPNRHVLPVWSGYAAAAVVLAVVAGASYVYFAETLDQPSNSVANVPMVPPKKSGPAVIPPPDADVAFSKPEVLSQPPKPEEEVVQVPPTGDNQPQSPDPNPDKPKDPTVFTAPASEMVELKMVDITAPYLVKLRMLDKANTKTDLLAELTKATGFRIEFPCGNGTRALERLQAACKASEITLHIDQTAVERIKYPHFRTNYAVYLEDVTPEELTRFLEQVAAEDKKTDAKKAIESQFDRIVLVRMGARDRKELSDLLGTDPTANAGATGPLGTDLHKPVSEQTGSQIAAALKGQGGPPPRPDGGKPAAKAVDHEAVVVPFTPLHPAAGSAEVKRYFDARKPARPGTLQLFLLIRETGS